MTATLRLGEARPARHRARLAADRQDAGAGARDALCRDVVIEGPGGVPAGGLRLRTCPDAAALAGGEAARAFDLAPLAALTWPVAEAGPVHVHPEASQAEVLRVAFAAALALADRAKAKALLALCPFEGTDPAPYAQAFALLRAGYVAPAEWLPARRAPEAVPLASLGRRPDRIAALRALPPLLRGWLGLGAWVSDHAVIDRDAGALRVLAILDLARLPRARAEALRALAPRLG
jgi:hypothetical protein